MHQHLVGGTAQKADNYPADLTSEILHGMRITADLDEEWGDETETHLVKAMMTNSPVHDSKLSSLERAMVKFEHKGKRV